MNTDSPFNGPAYDEKFVRGILVEIFGFEKLADYDMEPTKLQFMRDLLEVRVLRDASRLAYFEGYVQKKCNECKSTKTSNENFYAQLNL